MQEEVTQKTIALVFKSSRLTADVLKKAMKMYLEHRKQGKQMPHGKISVKELVGQGMGASSIEVTDNNIKSFESGKEVQRAVRCEEGQDGEAAEAHRIIQGQGCRRDNAGI
jgi:hypothetical protein